MTWGSYYFFYECPKCGKKYKWDLSDMNEDDFSKCPKCHVQGELKGETKEIKQGEDRFSEYESV